MTAALHVRVDGRVQGVGFRWFVREKALRLGVGGWVRNLPGGGVEVAAAGAPDAIAALRTAVARGPVGARVSAVVELKPVALVATPDFIIRRD